MQSTITATALFLPAAAASPLVSPRQIYTPCTGLYGTAQCCATDVLGIADLDCADPRAVPATAFEFQAGCAAYGQRARCCVLPLIMQGILCETPAGVID